MYPTRRRLLLPVQRTILWPTVRAHAHVTPEIIQTLSHDYKFIHLIALDNNIKSYGRQTNYARSWWFLGDLGVNS